MLHNGINDLIFTQDVLVFLPMTRSLWCTLTVWSCGKASQFKVSKNLNGKSLNHFNIFLSMKYASFEHIAYCLNIYGQLSYLRENYGKSPPKIRCK